MLHATGVAWLMTGGSLDLARPTLVPKAPVTHQATLVRVSIAQPHPPGPSDQPSGPSDGAMPSSEPTPPLEPPGQARFLPGGLPNIVLPDVFVQGLQEVRVAALVEVDAAGVAQSVSVQGSPGSPTEYADAVQQALSQASFEPSGPRSLLCVRVRFDLVETRAEVTPQMDLRMSKRQRCQRWALDGRSG